MGCRKRLDRKKWPEGRFPTIQELDMISPDKPMALERADGHAIIVNSLALEMANITGDLRSSGR